MVKFNKYDKWMLPIVLLIVPCIVFAAIIRQDWPGYLILGLIILEVFLGWKGRQYDKRKRGE